MEISRVPELRPAAPRSGASRSELLEQKHNWVSFKRLIHACTSCATFVILCEAVLSYDCPVVESTSILYVCYTLLHCTRELRRKQKIAA
ncbi:hypothetical protein CI102_7104 [Trichoderma harzianum]|nr:hypothetical protein CI102_7104 [Trichoderma harzianum]